MIDVKITGLAELQAMLDQLPAQIEKKLMRGALRAGQRMVLEQARQSIHNLTGDLAASIRVTTRARNGTVTATVKAGSKVAYYARFVEFGTSQHYIRPKVGKDLFFNGIARATVDHPGAKKRPFMRPAFDAAAQENSAAFRAVATYLQGRITAEMAQLPDEQDGVSK